MKTKFYLFAAIIILIFLIAGCTAPPADPDQPEQSAVEQAAESTSVAATTETEPALAEVENEIEPTSVPSPTIEPAPKDYPSPEPAAAVESYPSPETVVDSAYPEPAAESAADVEPEPISREVTIDAPDELALVGTLNTNGTGSPQPGVLLLHMLGGKRSDWDETGFINLLNEEGYATLTLDLRGHGDSRAEVDWAKAEEDINIVWEWFTTQPEVDSANSMIIGASIGSNLALRTAANQPTAKAAVLLSPGLNYREVTTDDAIATLDRPVLMVAMTLDSYSADSVVSLNEINPDHSIASIEEGSAHGTRMFGPYEGLEALIIEFLASNQG